jgi:hypothetical protein
MATTRVASSHLATPDHNKRQGFLCTRQHPRPATSIKHHDGRGLLPIDARLSLPISRSTIPKWARAGVAMEPDMNKYDLEHTCTAHGHMTTDQWQRAYHHAWLQYYSMNRIETLLRRAIADGIPAKRLMLRLAVFRGMPQIEDVHPLQGGYLRRKVRRTRRPGSPPQNALFFYVQHWAGTFVKAGRFVALIWRMNQIRRRAVREHSLYGYTPWPLPSSPRTTWRTDLS